MVIFVILTNLLIIGCFSNDVSDSLVNQCSRSESGYLLRIYGLKNGIEIFELDAFGTMPKRIKSKSAQKLKKIKSSLNTSPKRTPIPRTCKNTLTTKRKKKKSIVNFDFLSSHSYKKSMSFKPSHQDLEDSKKGWSSDELDVVYDIQEEKKNKIYEVITVMSDDETPNKITYERLYADDTEKKIVTSITDDISVNNIGINTINGSDMVRDVIKESVIDTKKENFIEKVIETNRTVNIGDKSDSDNEVVCLAVVDAKTKAEQKQKNIEEIVLSSDSETESKTTVPPLRLQLSNYPYISKFLQKDNSGSSVGSNTSNFSLGLRRTRLYPYVYGSKHTEVSNSLSDWDSNSTSAKASSSDELSPARTDSPKVLSSYGSSSSVLSDTSRPKRIITSSDDERSSSPSSSSDEEKEIYWKADRELRRKGELRYEEYTDLGKKVHEGETVVSEESSFTFKVMSYNVLAQKLLEQHMYLYKNHDRRALSWTRRWALLYNEIKDENPEILCLQEVEESHLVSHYAKLCDLGYKWVYKKRTGSYEDGVAVFYKTTLFEVEAQALVEFYQPGVSVLDRDNVGVVVRLRLKASPGNAIVIATTHLLYNPKRSDVRLAQMQVLLAEIDRLAYNKDALTYYPIIVTGDFNHKPRNGLYKLMTEGQLVYEATSRKSLCETNDHNVLPRLLLSWRLGITDRCQHVGVMEARVRGEDTARTKLYHSEDESDAQQEGIDDNDDYSTDERFESGKLCHGFNFQSVYPHTKLDGQKEASTHHDNWVTVDYIFYSTPKVKEGKKKEEGSLQLLSRLRLPTQDECDRFLRHLPNFAFGSDHLPLVGKFLLHLH